MVKNNKETKTSTENDLDSLRLRVEALESAAVKNANKKRRYLNKHYPLLYAFIAFIGLMFLWYGAWTIISMVPIIKNPFVSSGLGVVILLILGQFYSNLI